MLRILRSRRGTGLIDVMFTMSLMVVAGIIFSTIFPTGIRCSKQAIGYKIAAAIQQKKMEQVRGLNYESLTEVSLKSARVVDPDAAGVVNADGTSTDYSFTMIDALNTQLVNGKGTLTVTEVSSAIKSVTVTIKWDGEAGVRTRGVTATTLFTDKRPRKVT